MDVFNKFYSSVSNTVSQLSGVLPGNPVTREFEATQFIASAGPGLLWKIYKGYKKSTKQEASIFVFEKKQLEKFTKADRDIMLDTLKRGIVQLTKLRHPQILTVQHSLEESRESLAFATEPSPNHRTLGNIGSDYGKFKKFANELRNLPPSRLSCVAEGLREYVKLMLNATPELRPDPHQFLKKLGITKEVMATKVLPFLIPLCVENGLTLNQFNSLITLVKQMVGKVETEHRAKLEQLNSIKDESKLAQQQEVAQRINRQPPPTAIPAPQKTTRPPLDLTSSLLQSNLSALTTQKPQYNINTAQYNQNTSLYNQNTTTTPLYNQNTTTTPVYNQNTTTTPVYNQNTTTPLYNHN
ncbi:hypothetical protein MSG28_009499, partial [Choristoneura fumiferana]